MIQTISSNFVGSKAKCQNVGRVINVLVTYRRKYSFYWKTYLHALYSELTQKYISVSRHGASNMIGLQQELVTCIDRACLPRYYCIWCSAHQLDLFVQSMTQLANGFES
jgi:hypothetical protein